MASAVTAGASCLDRQQYCSALNTPMASTTTVVQKNECYRVVANSTAIAKANYCFTVFATHLCCVPAPNVLQPSFDSAICSFTSTLSRTSFRKLALYVLIANLWLIKTTRSRDLLAPAILLALATLLALAILLALSTLLPLATLVALWRNRPFPS